MNCSLLETPLIISRLGLLYVGPDVEILKIAAPVAGIGGLAIGALLIIFREVIRKNIFPSLTKTEAYRLLRLIVILVWTIALAGIIAWVYVKQLEQNTSTPPRLVSGIVVDHEGKGIPDAEVFVIGGLERDRTTSSGNFFLALKGEKISSVRLQAAKDGYISWNDSVEVPNTHLRIPLKPVDKNPTDQDQKPTLPNAHHESAIVKQKKEKASTNRQKTDTPPLTVDQRFIKPGGER